MENDREWKKTMATIKAQLKRLDATIAELTKPIPEGVAK